LAIYFEDQMFVISTVNLDKYQMIDLYWDVYATGEKCGVDILEYYGFVYCSPRLSRKLSLKFDEDWINLFSV